MNGHSAQDCLAPTMSRMVEEIETETGMIGTVILGGPEPRQGGKIVVMRSVQEHDTFSRLMGLPSFHSGKTAFGSDFGHAYDGWMEKVELPYTEYLTKIFGNFLYRFRCVLVLKTFRSAKDVCMSRALLGTVIDNSPSKPQPTTSPGVTSVNSSCVSTPAQALTSTKLKRKSGRLKPVNVDDIEVHAVNETSEYKQEKATNIARNKIAMRKLAEEWKGVIDGSGAPCQSSRVGSSSACVVLGL